MRIERLKFKNFRQFKDVEIVLKKVPGKKDIHVFVGVMGTGKSNILNAINWCLYGVEPFLSRKEKDKQLPLINTKILEDSREGDQYRVGVEIHAESNGKPICFTRNQNVVIGTPVNGGGRQCDPGVQQFRVVIRDEAGSSRIFEGDEAQEKVDLFVPDGIKEFFFFDGERLDKYFREATGQRIRNAIHQISQVGLLNRMTDHLQKVMSDLQKDAGKLSPNIEEIRTEYEKAQDDLQTYVSDIDKCKSEISTAKGRLRELEGKLQNVPETESLETERADLNGRRTEIEGLLREKKRAKDDFLFFSGTRALLRPAVERTIAAIEQMYQNKELPPTFDKRLLETLLDEGKCICGRPLDCSTSEARAVRDLIETIRLSPEASQRLTAIESLLRMVMRDVESYSTKNTEITQVIAELEDSLGRTQERIEEIDRVLGGYELDQIRVWNEERKRMEEALDTCQQQMGYLKHLKEDAEKKVKELADKLRTELRKESKVAELKNDITFVENTIQVLHKANRGILDKIRHDIERRTEENFMRLHWKKETYKGIVIDHDYSISPIHALGFDSLGTISGGEREVLALSFSMALHETSGFRAAIVIDRPLAMVSGVTRTHIAEIFSKVGEDRQIVLLLTPEDYAADVRTVLEPVLSTSARLQLLRDENELKLEED